ncbi:MAG: TIGR03084 family metal-binding protein [Pseudomonadota bacterium]
MFRQVSEFADECAAFADLIDRALTAAGPRVFDCPTLFKQWTLNDILSHLHVWNWAADTALHDPARFEAFFGQAAAAMQRNKMKEFEQQWLKDLRHEALFDSWRAFVSPMCERFGNADPQQRVKWAGPDMSVRSSISARLMETWSHAQAFYDLAGEARQDQARLLNVVVLGVNTYKWTFRNRGLALPADPPKVLLRSPIGEPWQFNTDSETGSVQGTATEFCQVVTQVRNIRDTQLEVEGNAAANWMNIAQCFAGPPVDPPPAGTRSIAEQHMAFRHQT